MRCGRRIILGLLVLGTFACADPDAELREAYQAASLALADHRVPGSTKIVMGRDGWIFHKLELQYLNLPSLVGENATRANHQAPPEFADSVAAIVDFHRQLQERGLELYVLPVPVRPVIYPESVLGSEAFAQRDTIPNLHPPLQELLTTLQANGVRAFDVTPIFLGQREHPVRGAVFVPSDTHWTPYGISLAVNILAAEIKEQPWFEAVPKQRYHQRWTTKTISGRLYKRYEDATGTVLEPDFVQIRRILLETDEGLEDFGLHHPQSPVILIGDSNAARWSNLSSGLPHTLAFELGFPVDVLSAAGGGANTSRLNLARKFRAEPEYLEGKRAVIWCFTARSLVSTREGWVQIPL